MAQGELRTRGASVPDKARVSATRLRRQAFGLGWTPLGRPEMTDLLQDVILLPADGARRRLASRSCANRSGRYAGAIMREKRMLVHIFRGPGRVFGCTNDATGANLPAQYRPWSSFKSLDLSRDGEPTPGVNANECLDDIEKYGFHITDAHVRITENLV